MQSTPDAFRTLAQRFPHATFVMEACGSHEWIHDVLVAAGMKVFVCYPPKKDPPDRKKDDWHDAERLGRKFLAGDLVQVRVPPPDARRARDVVRHRAFLVETRTSTINRVKHALHRWGFRHDDPEAADDPFSAEGRTRVLDAFPAMAHEFDLVDLCTARVKQLDREIHRLADTNPVVRRLRTIPGFGDLVALTFWCDVWDIGRFPSADHLVAYIGLDPEWGASGENRWDKHRMSKTGRAYLRGLLDQAALAHATHAASDISSQHAALRARKNSGVAIGRTMRKLVKTAYWVWKEDRDFTLTRPARFVPCRTSPGLAAG